MLTRAPDLRGVFCECQADVKCLQVAYCEALVGTEERHYDQYDTELEHLAKFGDEYLALQFIERSTSSAVGRPTE